MELKEYRYENLNALDFLRKMPNNSINLVVTSPPYNIGKEYEARKSLDDYLNDLRPIIKEIDRTLAANGSVCWEVGNYIDEKTKEIYPLDIYFYNIFKEYGFKLRNRIIWHFGHGLQCENRFSGRYESILWFSKSDSYIFNLDDVRIPSKYPGKKHYKGNNKGQYSGNPKGKNPEDVWNITIERLYDDWEKGVWDVPNVKANHPEKTIHPCQFPIELVERCVLALTNEGDIVYDPFAGVGSTLIAALKNNRIAYGTELEENYIDIGKDRIEKLKNNILKIRPIYQRIYEPNGKDSVSKFPKEWLEKRLKDISVIRDEMRKEEEEIKKKLEEYK